MAATRCWRKNPSSGPDRTPVGRDVGEFAHHHALAPRSQRLVVERRDAVVADVRVREADDLTGVTRVGDHLLVARERGVEDELTAGEARLGQVSGGVALEGGAVGEHEDGRLARHASAPSSTTSAPLAIVARTRPTRARPSYGVFIERLASGVAIDAPACTRVEDRDVGVLAGDHRAAVRAVARVVGPRVGAARSAPGRD